MLKNENPKFLIDVINRIDKTLNRCVVNARVTTLNFCQIQLNILT